MQSNEFAVHRDHVLPRGRILSIRDGRNSVIFVWRGSIWVTQERDPCDRELGPGEWLELDRDGLAIVQAYERSAFTVTTPRRDVSSGVLERLRMSLLHPFSSFG